MDHQSEESSSRIGNKDDRVTNSSPNIFNLKFRNYTPQTQFLDGLYAIEKTQPQSIIPYIQDKLDILSIDKDGDGDAINENDDDGNANKYKIDPKILDPKKIDWDLKRRLEKRLDKLERETRKQIDNHVKSRNKTK